jgi:tRNA(Ile)-lysidine synthetase-like protein
MPAHFTNRIADAMSLAGVSPAEQLLVAFSGGRDSVALVEALLMGGFHNLTLVHMDHALRPESASEAEWVKSFAERRNLPWISRRIAVQDLAAAHGTGIEETARSARYSFFAAVAKELGHSKVVLAHHADDQIETLVFRLLRGSGVVGLAAMATKSEIHTDGTSLTLLRPMLGIWRSDIDALILKRGLGFLEDPSNAKHDFTRNRIRHLLLPEMERVMRRPVRKALWRAAEVLRSEEEFMADAELALGGVSETLEVNELKCLPIALRRRRVARWLSLRGVPDISFEVVEAVSNLAIRFNPSKVNLPKGAHARRKAGRIFIESPQSNSPTEGQSI